MWGNGSAQARGVWARVQRKWPPFLPDPPCPQLIQALGAMVLFLFSLEKAYFFSTSMLYSIPLRRARTGSHSIRRLPIASWPKIAWIRMARFLFSPSALRQCTKQQKMNTVGQCLCLGWVLYYFFFLILFYLLWLVTESLVSTHNMFCQQEITEEKSMRGNWVCPRRFYLQAFCNPYL